MKYEKDLFKNYTVIFQVPLKMKCVNLFKFKTNIHKTYMKNIPKIKKVKSILSKDIK